MDMSEPAMKISDFHKQLPIPFSTFGDWAALAELSKVLFLDHQQQCMKGFWENAYARLYAFYHLREHAMQIEEQWLIPLYQSQIAEIPKGGAVKYFLREHVLIRKNLQSFLQRINHTLCGSISDEPNLVSLFEEYHLFKDLLDHHDSRDRVFLYRELDTLQPRNEFDAVLTSIRSAHLAFINHLERQV